MKNALCCAALLRRILYERLTHSTCERNVASCSKDATIELGATDCRVGKVADDLARNVIGQGNEAAAMIEAASGALLTRSFLEDGGQGELSRLESLLRFKKAARG
jgi:hypothetical protein